MSNNVLPAFAFLGKMTNTITNNDFWGILQTDLQSKILVSNEENVSLNYKKTNLLHQSIYLQEEIINQLAFNNNQLEIINSQLSQLNYMISSKIHSEECEKISREVIYNIKKIDEQLEHEKDRIFVAIQANFLLKMIEINQISTASFNQISDKEYFDTVIKSVISKIEQLTNEEKTEIEGFLDVYTYAIDLREQLKSTKNEKVINRPESLHRMEKPANNNTLEAKIKEIVYLNNSRLFESIDNENKYNELIQKYKICETVINMYLEKHPLLQEDYPILNYEETEPEIVDYNYILERCNSFIETEKKKYLEESKVDTEDQTFNKIRNSQKRRKNKKILKTIIITIIIFIVLFIIYMLSKIEY